MFDSKCGLRGDLTLTVLCAVSAGGVKHILPEVCVMDTTGALPVSWAPCLFPLHGGSSHARNIPVFG